MPPGSTEPAGSTSCSRIVIPLARPGIVAVAVVVAVLHLERLRRRARAAPAAGCLHRPARPDPVLDVLRHGSGTHLRRHGDRDPPAAAAVPGAPAELHPGSDGRRYPTLIRGRPSRGRTAAEVRLGPPPKSSYQRAPPWSCRRQGVRLLARQHLPEDDAGDDLRDEGAADSVHRPARGKGHADTGRDRPANGPCDA